MWEGGDGIAGGWLTATILNVNESSGKITYDVQYKDDDECEEDKLPFFVQDLKSKNTKNPFDLNDEPSEEEEEEYEEEEEEEEETFEEGSPDDELVEVHKAGAKEEDWYMSQDAINALGIGKVGDDGHGLSYEVQYFTHYS